MRISTVARREESECAAVSWMGEEWCRTAKSRSANGTRTKRWTETSRLAELHLDGAEDGIDNLWAAATLLLSRHQPQAWLPCITCGRSWQWSPWLQQQRDGKH